MMKTRILLVDDHKVFREGLRKLLGNELDMEVVGEAADGPSARTLAAELSPNLVIMDISMPGLNGIEITRALRKLPDPPQVIVLSMHSDKRFVTQSLQAGASGYVLKEAAFDELALAIRAVRNNRTYLCPKIASIVADDYRQTLLGANTRETASLTTREREVLQLLAEGHGTKDIANTLHISIKTVETHRRNIMQRLKIDSLAELIKYAIREGITHV